MGLCVLVTKRKGVGDILFRKASKRGVSLCRKGREKVGGDFRQITKGDIKRGRGENKDRETIGPNSIKGIGIGLSKGHTKGCGEEGLSEGCF